ncbi:hypothetical protein TA3x_001200 [Tundrisphaera sp. TA3]|uniref:hypothetical protein n=1 Tax=Tundrisphaera sp. TA3 TaxID=3435775 RepID=UPI003EBD57B5
MRLTIGGLMALVLFAGLALWVRIQVIARLTPSIPEQAALAAYQQSMLTREVAEVALVEYDSGRYKQVLSESVRPSHPEVGGGMPILRWKGDRLPGSNPWPDRGPKEIARRLELEKLVGELKAKATKAMAEEVAKAKADEASKLMTYHRERARRMRPFGIW